MIELVYQNETALVYKIEDWEILRKQFRIVGNFLGSTQYVPALPLRLLPEEALLLLNKGLATLVKYQSLKEEPNNLQEQQDLQRKLLEEEKKIYRELRRQQIESYEDKIVAGKRKKGDTRSKEEILQEECDKAGDISEENMIWPIMTTNDFTGEKTIISNKEILKRTTNVHSMIYQDLWEKGYFITSGHKFGGDFLVYGGDPIMFHAIYIIKCLQSETENIHSSELIAFGRLATSVKKRAILATLNPQHEIKYITINWMDSF